MSGVRQIVSGGYPAVDEDMQRMADAAAGADDLAHAFSCPPGELFKSITPLDREELGGNQWRSIMQNSVTTGRVSIAPCILVAGPTTGTTAKKQIVVQLAKVIQEYETVISAAFASNSSGSTRYDTVYATLQRTNTVIAARKIKDPTTGVISTQPSTVLASEPTVTLSIITGGSSAPTSPTWGGIPADTSTSWNFPLGYIEIPNGYVSGGTLVGMVVRQIWPGGFLPEGRIRACPPASIMAEAYTGVNGRADTNMGSRFGTRVRRSCVYHHTSAFSALDVLDTSIDWRNRLITIKAALPVAHTTTRPTPPNVTIVGAAFNINSAMIFTGNGSASTALASVDTGGGNLFEVFVDTDGDLKLRANYTPIASSGGDNWWIEVEATERFLTDDLGA